MLQLRATPSWSSVSHTTQGEAYTALPILRDMPGDGAQNA